MSKERAARIANSPGASSRGGKKSGSGSSSRSNSSQGGTTAQKKAAGRKGGKAAAKNLRIDVKMFNAGAEQDGSDVEHQLVDHARRERLPHGGSATGDVHAELAPGVVGEQGIRSHDDARRGASLVDHYHRSGRA